MRHHEELERLEFIGTIYLIASLYLYTHQRLAVYAQVNAPL